jgi:hypothetical protein
MPPVEALGIGAQQPFHSKRQIGLRSFDDQVKMVGHEAVGVNLPAGLLTSLSQSAKELGSILVVVKNVLPMIAAANDMIARTFILDAKWARHDRKLLSLEAAVSIVSSDPFSFPSIGMIAF